jgi:hypothetical protein
MHARPRRLTVLLVALALALAACGEGGDTEDEETAGPAAEGTDLSIAVASFDLHVGEGQRLIAGVLTPDRGLVAFGEVEMELVPAAGDPADAQTVSAQFLPVPGSEPEGSGSEPTVVIGDSGAGVYEAEVDLDQAGPWQLEVTAELADGTTRRGTGGFQVGEEPGILAVGDEAHRTENLTLADIDGDEVRPVMVDSRGQDGEDADDVPDHHLHETTIAESIEAGRPVVALFSTPVYCVSRFCGPITEVFADIAEQYDDRADFVHVEVWRDFDAQELNEAAAEWLQPQDGGGGGEPWTFLIDEDGRVAARWDNVLDADDLIDHLEELPPLEDAEA